jgi:hypothetical protein
LRKPLPGRLSLLCRLVHLDRAAAAPVRYERERPGELLHVDVKKLGNIPIGGGLSYPDLG